MYPAETRTDHSLQSIALHRLFHVRTDHDTKPRFFSRSVGAVDDRLIVF